LLDGSGCIVVERRRFWSGFDVVLEELGFILLWDDKMSSDFCCAVIARQKSFDCLLVGALNGCIWCGRRCFLGTAGSWMRFDGLLSPWLADFQAALLSIGVDGVCSVVGAMVLGGIGYDGRVCASHGDERTE
jgi:hypothetical protein